MPPLAKKVPPVQCASAESPLSRSGGKEQLLLDCILHRFLRSKVIKLTLLACLCTNALIPNPTFAYGNIDLANLTLSQGFSIAGAMAGDTSGHSVSIVGDVNKDGFADFIIGAFYASPKGRKEAGQSYIIYGGGNRTNIDLANLSLSQGFSIIGAMAYDYSGWSVSRAGDVNKDGYDDVVIGAYNATRSGKQSVGESYVIYGGENLTNIDLANITFPRAFSLTGASALDASGIAVSGAGDVNKDGYDDIIVGAYGASPNGKYQAGQSYVVYGGISRYVNVDLSNLTSSQGFSVLGASERGLNGFAVSTAGDVNGDGYGDVIIGAYDASPLERPGAGISYVIYGGSNLTTIDLASNFSLTRGVAFYGATALDYSGYSVGVAGDVNKDGYSDVVIGAISASPLGRHAAGISYVIYGGLNLTDIDFGSNFTSVRGFAIYGVADHDESGVLVNAAGDTNGDGFDDIIVGAYGAAPLGRLNAGASYVIYGSTNHANIDLATNLTATNGFAIYGASVGDYSGQSGGGIGDVNGDGYGDLIVGAYNASPLDRANAGVSYVVYGGPRSIQTTMPMTTSSGTLAITSSSTSTQPASGLTTQPFVTRTISLFETAVKYTVGSNPEGIALGDVNRDGRLDLLAANYGSDTVSVLLGHGNGTFAVQQEYAVGGNPSGITVADVNEDGILDILAVNAASNTVSVLLGYGDGAFSEKQDLPVGRESRGITVTDVNRDGKTDILTANGVDNTISVLLGFGNGTFAVHQDYAVGVGPWKLVTGDVNGDGTPDVLTGNRGATTVSVLLGYGNGTFAACQNYTVGAGPLGIAVSDINADGNLDILTGNSDSSTVSVLLGYGNGTFEANQDYLIASGTYGVFVIDINGDGKLDVLTANPGSDTVSVLLGYGNGTFAPHQDYAVDQNHDVDSYPLEIIVADLNTDGKPDVLTANYLGNATSVLLNTGQLSCSLTSTMLFTNTGTYTVGPGALGIASADVNADGQEDILTANWTNSTVSVLFGYGNGTFTTHQDFEVGSNPYGVFVADVNGDGKQDVVTANGGITTVSVLLGYGNGSFATHQDYPVGGGAAKVFVTDVNRDGKADILTANGVTSSTVSLLLGYGNGTFAPKQDFSVASLPLDISVADINGDGKLDVITACPETNAISVLSGYGNGSFAAHQDYLTGSKPTGLALADINHDGKLDALTTGVGAGAISVLLGYGNGSFGAYQDYTLGNQITIPVGTSTGIAVADINNDGMLDVLVANGASVVYTLLGYGNGSFATHQDYTVGGQLFGVVIGDVNKDGKPDILTAADGYPFSTVTVLLNTYQPVCPATTTLAQPTTIITSSTSATTAPTTANPSTVSLATSSSGITNVLDLANLTLSEGFSIAGISGQSGWPARNAGDVDNDGYADLIIGAARASVNGRYQAGQAYVVYGGENLINLDLANLLPSQGFSITGASAGDLCGVSVNGAGDVNNDGYSDLVIGAPYAFPGGKQYAGTSYVIYGGSNLTNLDLANLTMTQGFSIAGAAAGGYSGTSVSGVGDVNQDGYGDVIIGTPNNYASYYGNSPNGKSHVIYGGKNITNLDLGNLPASRGFSITGAVDDLNGYSVSGAGDVNKDGHPDIIIGAVHASPNGKYQAGQTYVIYGGKSLTSFDLANLNQSQGFSVFGTTAGDWSGVSVRSAGDVNKDGYDDVIIGALYASPSGRHQAGQSYVIYGGKNLTNLDLAHLAFAQGFSIEGAAVNDTSGYSVSGAGDINADGYDDVIIGALFASPNGRHNAGQSYVIYGGTSLTNIDLPSLSSSQGFFINGASGGVIGDESGASVSAAGDINKDGYADLIIGAADASPGGRQYAGVSYVIYGKASGTETTASLPKTTTTPSTSVTLNLTTQDNGGASATSSSSSWTGTIIGVTVGVVAVIGAGYLAYLKWRSPRPRNVGPVTAVLGALQEGGHEDRQMQTNPVYDGVQKTQYELLERQYEQPHQDTWSASAYDTGGEKLQSPVAYDQVVLDDGYEKPHPNTWLPQNYEIIERGGLTYTAPDPINPIDLNQDPWGFGEEV